MRFSRGFTQSVSNELTVHCVLAHAPDGSGMKIAALALCRADTPEEAEAEIAPIRAFGSPVLEMLGLMPYPAINAVLDAGFPRGALKYWKSSLVAELSDSLIDEAVTRFATTPSPLNAILIEHDHRGDAGRRRGHGGAAPRDRPTTCF